MTGPTTPSIDAVRAPGPVRPSAAPAIPPNFFGIPFGLAGLGESWATEARFHHAPTAVGELILLLSAATWVAVLGAYCRHAVRNPRVLLTNLLDPVAAPFVSLALITPMLLASVGLYPHTATTGKAVTDVFLVLTLLLGGWFTGQWIYGPMDLDKFHPGYFLPTVAGGLVASASAAAVGQHTLAQVMFGFGLISWIVLGSILLGRLLFRPMLPPPLQPTLAIEVAPAAVASLAWFELNGGRIDTVMAALAGYGLLMVIAQLRLLPLFLRLPFMPSTWAFTFSWAAVATTGLVWLQHGQSTGYRTEQYAVLAVITALIGGIGARTLRALAAGRLLPHPVPTPTAPA